MGLCVLLIGQSSIDITNKISTESVNKHFFVKADKTENSYGPVGGHCTVEPKACFQYPVTAIGTPDGTNPSAVSSYCIGSTSSSAVNGSAGLGGPGRLRTDQNNQCNYTSLP